MVRVFNSEKPVGRIEMFMSKDGWRWRIRAFNGRILASSEAYSAFNKCSDIAEKIGRVHKFEVCVIQKEDV